MPDKITDIVIFGAGISGLWLLNTLKSKGYNTVLVYKDGVGGKQSVASQGIIHSGLKYALGGKVNKLAQSISAMPDRWRDALNGTGEIDLSAANISASSQQLMIPKGFIGGIVNVLTQKALGDQVGEVPKDNWPQELETSGFDGRVVNMHEMVLDIPSVVKALCEKHADSIVPLEEAENLTAQRYIYTAAEGNMPHAEEKKHANGLKTQKRPLLMGLMKPAPFPLYAHLVGKSEKPVASITTHKMKNGTLVWYFGGGVAERETTANPDDLFKDIKAALKKYIPHMDTNNVSWAAVPINRIEGKSDTQGWMPDTPTIHANDDHIYCWPTKLTFAPMLSDMVMKQLEKDGIKPSRDKPQTGSSSIIYLDPPWENVEWY